MAPPPSLQELIETVQRDTATDDELDLLSTASVTARQLEEVNDALLGHFVNRCRLAGRSWSEISDALGVTKQAVHKRFSGALADRIIEAVPRPTLERFTLRARGTLKAAVRAARALGHSETGTEHLLLGLFDDPEGLAARALSAMNVRREAVEAAVLTARPRGSAVPSGEPGAPSGQSAQGPEETADPPYSSEVRTALRDALAEALALGHNYIGTEHILLGLYRSGDSLAAGILQNLGADQAEVKVRLTEMLRGLNASS